MKLNYPKKTNGGLKALIAGLFLLGTFVAKAQCSANFTYTLGPNGLVTLASTSTGTTASTYYSWNIGGSPTSGGSTASHIYSTNGYKLICLTIVSNTTSPSSCSSSYCDSVLITNIASPCSANFNYTYGANGSVSFVSTSTGTSVSTNYSWNFGGSSTASGLNPSHTYTSNGYKTVCLTITNSVTNCSSTFCDSLLISNVSTSTTSPCNANFSYVLGSNGSVSFVSTSTGTTLGTYYSWNFGGSASGTGLAPNYTFTTNGPKVVCLTITDTLINCSSTHCSTLNITNVTGSVTPCNASFTYSMGANGLVYFVSTSTGTSVSTNYSWNFGGTATSTLIAPSITYTSNGHKWMCLTITNSVTNCTSMYCDSLIITNVTGSVTPCTPSVVFTMAKDSSMALTWNAYPTYPSNVTGATWSWGDGNTSTGLYPSHTYSTAGTYSICVTISVSCGTVTATYCYVASIFRSTENMDMIYVNVKPATPTGIKNVTKADALLSIYPNPSNGEFVLELAGSDLRENTVLIYNMMGEKVFEKQILNGGKQNLDASHLANGTYFVKVNSEAGYAHKKITIQK